MVGMLEVVVVEAKGLPAADRGGTSDPYVRLGQGRSKAALTSVVKRDLNPEWRESFTLQVDDQDPFLHVAVYDEDRLRDDFLGRVDVEIAAFNDGLTHDNWYSLESKKGKSAGQIRLAIKALGEKIRRNDDFVASRTGGALDGASGAETGGAFDGDGAPGPSDVGAGVGGAGSGGGEGGKGKGKDKAKAKAKGKEKSQPKAGPVHEPNCVIIKVVQARNLGNMKLDPYCRVTHGGDSMKTRTVTDNMHPRWNEQFVFDLNEFDPAVVLDIYDHDVFRDDFLGRVMIELELLRDMQIHSNWYPLEEKSKDGVSKKKKLLQKMKRRSKISGELFCEASIEYREEIRKSDRATSIKKTDVDAGLFEAVYFLLLIIITVTLKLTGFIG